jgi:hypothetical protein
LKISEYSGLEDEILELAQSLEEWGFGEGVDKTFAMIGGAVVLWHIYENFRHAFIMSDGVLEIYTQLSADDFGHGSCTTTNLEEALSKYLDEAELGTGEKDDENCEDVLQALEAICSRLRKKYGSR